MNIPTPKDFKRKLANREIDFLLGMIEYQLSIYNTGFWHAEISDEDFESIKSRVEGFGWKLTRNKTSPDGYEYFRPNYNWYQLNES